MRLRWWEQRPLQAPRQLTQLSRRARPPPPLPRLPSPRQQPRRLLALAPLPKQLVERRTRACSGLDAIHCSKSPVWGIYKLLMEIEMGV